MRSHSFAIDQEYFMNLSEQLSTHQIFEVVGTCADQLDLETYVVGGFVRDLLLKRPNKDIDFVAVGDGVALANRVTQLLGENVNVTIYKNFGTAAIRFDDYEFEFVGARKESYRHDSRKPIVAAGTLKEDQERRDFTINAMAICLNSNRYGELIDPFDGTRDLRRKMLQTPLDADTTFSDDPLRMMRAIRFATQLQFDIAPDTYDGIIRNVERMTIVSAERITDELNKIIVSNEPSYGFKLLYHSGLLAKVFPELAELQGVEVRNGQSHKDNFYHTLQVLDNISLETNDLWLRWAAILHDIAKPATKRFHPKAGWTFHGHEDKGARMVPKIFRRLRLPQNEKMRYVQKLVRLHLRPIPLVRDNITDAAVRRLLFEAGDDVDDLMTLCKADITSKNHERVKRYIRNFEKVQEKMIKLEEKDHLRNFQPPVTGEKIMEVFKLKPGRVVGDIKEEIREAILDGTVPNEYEAAYKLMLEIGKKKGLEIAS